MTVATIKDYQNCYHLMSQNRTEVKRFVLFKCKPVEYTEIFKYLGVVLDNTLSFNDHTLYIRKKSIQNTWDGQQNKTIILCKASDQKYSTDIWYTNTLSQMKWRTCMVKDIFQPEDWSSPDQLRKIQLGPPAGNRTRDPPNLMQCSA